MSSLSGFGDIEVDGRVSAIELQGTQTGGINKTYTFTSTGYKTVLRIKDATTFWTNLSGSAYIKVLIQTSPNPFETAVTTSSKISTWLVDCVYSGTSHAIIGECITLGATNADYVMRYFGSHAPKSTSYAPCIALAPYSANTIYCKVTVLSCSDGWELLDTLGGDPGTTNYNAWRQEFGRYNYYWSSLNYSASVNGSAGSVWDTISNDRWYFGEAMVGGSMVAVASDGLAWKVGNTNKAFKMPMVIGRVTGTFAVTSTYHRANWQWRGIALTELTNATTQGRAFTLPSSYTWNDYLYLRGSLDNGYFKPDGTIGTSMTAGYTWVLFGRVDRANQTSGTPTQFTYLGGEHNALTLDEDGYISHINGKSVLNTSKLRTVITQNLSAGENTIAHNMNIEYPHVSIYVDNLLVDAKVTYVNANSVKIETTSAYTGAKIVISI